MRRFFFFGCIAALIIQMLWMIAGGILADRIGKPKEDWTTDTWSADFKGDQDKIEFLMKYVNCPTKVLDAEYHITYHDNSHGLVPGPSDWRISAAIKVDPGDIREWTDGMEEVPEDQIDTGWWEGLDISDWGLDDSAAYYKRDSGSYLVVYAGQGILLKCFWTY